MAKMQYKGTSGLKPSQALNDLKSMQEKYSLNDTEDSQFKERFDILEDFLHTAEDYIEKLEKFKEYGLNKLSKKDLAQYLEEEYLKR